MNSRIVAFLLFLSAFLEISGQNCKPSYEKKDPVTQNNVVVWNQRIFASSFGSSFFSTSSFYFSLSFGYYGNGLHAVNLIIQKSEDSKTAAQFESQIKAAVGNKFFLGLPDGGPLVFEADQVSNESKIDRALGTGLWTTVVLSDHISEQDWELIQPELLNKEITSFRVDLESDITIQKEVKGKHSQKLKTIFTCYKEYLESNQIEFSGASMKVENDELDDMFDNLKRSEDGYFEYSNVYEVEGIEKEEIYRRVKTNWMPAELIQFIEKDIEPHQISFRYPFKIENIFGKATQTFEFKSGKFRYSISQIEYTSNGKEWLRPEDSGFADMLLWIDENIEEFTSDFEEQIIKNSSDDW